MGSNRYPKLHQGYTLIELVVVLLVIGVTLSLVIPRLSLPDQHAKLNQHARNIQTLVHAVQDHSIMLGRVMGIQAKDNSLQVMQLRQGAWEKRKSDNTLQPYQLNPPFKVQLDVGQPLFKQSKQDTQTLPAMILPDGQITTFEVILTNTQTGEGILLRQDINRLTQPKLP